MSGARARDVVVVGGGPAGAAAAILLRQPRARRAARSTRRASRATRSAARASRPRPGACWTVWSARAAVRALRPHPLRGMSLVSPRTARVPRRRTGGPTTTWASPCGATGSTRRCSRGARDAGVEVREGARVTRPSLRRRAGHGRDRRTADGAERIRRAPGGRRRRPAQRGRARPRPAARAPLAPQVRGARPLGRRRGPDASTARCTWAAAATAASRRSAPRRANVAFVLDRRAMARARRRPRGVLPRDASRRAGPAAERLAGRDASWRRRARSARWPWWRARLGPGRAAGRRRRRLLRSVHRRGRDARAAQRGAGGGDGGPRRCASGRTDDLRAYDRARHAATRDKFRLNRLLQRVVAWPALRQRGGAAAGAPRPTSRTSWSASRATSCPRGRRSAPASSRRSSGMSAASARRGPGLRRRKVEPRARSSRSRRPRPRPA